MTVIIDRSHLRPARPVLELRGNQKSSKVATHMYYRKTSKRLLGYQAFPSSRDVRGETYKSEHDTEKICRIPHVFLELKLMTGTSRLKVNPKSIDPHTSDIPNIDSLSAMQSPV